VCLQQPELIVGRIAEFLGYSLSAEQRADIVRRTCFNVMKQDSSVNYSWWDDLGMRVSSESQFMRKGITLTQLSNQSGHIYVLPMSQVNQRCLKFQHAVFL